MAYALTSTLNYKHRDSFATRGKLLGICNAIIQTFNIIKHVICNFKEMIDQRINYTHENPVRALIVAEPHDYLFSSARDYAGEKGYVNVQTEI